MVSALNDTSLFKDDDAVTVADRREAVGNDKRRSALHQAVHALLYDALGTGVDGAGSLIENEHRRIGNRRPRDGQQLALSLA